MVESLPKSVNFFNNFSRISSSSPPLCPESFESLDVGYKGFNPTLGVAIGAAAGPAPPGRLLMVRLLLVLLLLVRLLKVLLLDLLLVQLQDLQSLIKLLVRLHHHKL